MRPTVRERSLHDALAAHPPVSFTATARQFHLLRRSAEKGTGQLFFWTSPRWSFSRTSPKRGASSDWLFRATPPNNLPATSPDSAGGFPQRFPHPRHLRRSPDGLIRATPALDSAFSAWLGRPSRAKNFHEKPAQKSPLPCSLCPLFNDGLVEQRLAPLVIK